MNFAANSRLSAEPLDPHRFPKNTEDITHTHTPTFTHTHTLMQTHTSTHTVHAIHITVSTVRFDDTIAFHEIDTHQDVDIRHTSKRLFVVLAISQYCKFSGGQYTPPFSKQTRYT